MLNDALITTHAGIAGPWQGAGSNPKHPLHGASDSDLLYLTAQTRGDLIDSLLMGSFGFQGAFPNASVMQGATPLFTLQAPDSKFFKAQLALVRNYADLRDDRLAEVNAQIDDMLSFFGLVGLLDNGRRRHSLELLGAVIRLAVHVEMPLKHFCRSARPIDHSAQIQPMIQTPDHSSFPSGHAMETFAAATVLHLLRIGKAADAAQGIGSMPFRIAHRVAVNRTVAGVHFPVDSLAGALVGVRLGLALARMAAGAQPLPPVSFERQPKSKTAMVYHGGAISQPFSDKEDFTLATLHRLDPLPAGLTAVQADRKRPFGALWALAANEWQ